LRICSNSRSSAASNPHSKATAYPCFSTKAAAIPNSAGPGYPTSSTAIIPTPSGFPRDTVTPDVSECNRIPASCRPTSNAINPCAPSCAIVTT
jgi:hypothetical protein